MINTEFTNAIAYARQHATAGLKVQRFDPVYLTTLDQLAVIDATIAQRGDLRNLRSGEITLGLMAAKELGNDEADFAHALHVIQWEADTATGDNAEYRL